MRRRRNRRHGTEQRIISLEIIGEGVLEPLRGLFGRHIVARRGIRRCKKLRDDFVNLRFVAGGLPFEAGFGLQDVKLGIQIQAVVLLERRKTNRLDDAAQALQGPRRRLHRRGDIGRHRTETRRHQPPDPERTIRLRSHAGIEADRTRRIAVDAVRSRQDRVGQGNIADASGHRADMPEAPRHPRPVPRRGDAPMRGLERGDAGVGRRAAQRKGDIAADPDGRQARRDRRRLPAARSTGRAVEIPRIAGPSRQQIVGLRCVGELGQVGLGDQDRAGPFETRDAGRIRPRNAALEDGGTTLRRHAGGVERILDGERNSMQRAEPGSAHHLRFGGPCRRDSLLGGERDDGVQPWIGRGDPIEVRLDDLDGRKPPGPDQRGQLRRIRISHVPNLQKGFSSNGGSGRPFMPSDAPGLRGEWSGRCGS